ALPTGPSTTAAPAATAPAAIPVDDTDPSDQVADAIAVDLLDRLGDGHRALLDVITSSAGPWSLPALAQRTGDSISRLQSRWANLGRSIDRTRSRFANIEIFTEQPPNSDGYSTFLMVEGIRAALRQRLHEG